jgi:signal transduction histidine kinase
MVCPGDAPPVAPEIGLTPVLGIMTLSPLAKTSKPRKNLWFERAMAIAATVNLGLVGFDLTYVMWRDFWLRGTLSVFDLVTVTLPLPPITQLYDPIKGIESHRDTTQYLAVVAGLEHNLRQGGLQSAAVQQDLADLRDRSIEMVQTNPFQVANKSGTLEKIKNRMRERIYAQALPTAKKESAKKAFETFWSADYLSQKGAEAELKFFNQEIRPLIATNYFRAIGENGEPTDRFWLIDAPFVTLFGLEFLARTFYLSRRRQSLTWLDAMLWRWYDLLLLIPIWRWLRVIPVVVRLEAAEWVDWSRVRDQATRGFVATIAEDMAEVVVVQVIDRFQESLRQGDITRFIVETANRPYIDLNQRDEIKEIISHLLKTTLRDVMPKIKPDLEAVISNTIEAVLNQSPAYQGLKGVPGLGQLPRQINQRLVADTTATAYSALVAIFDDPAVTELATQLVKNFGKHLTNELKDRESLQELQSLVNDLLEEVKVTYVRRLETTDVEELLEETRQIRRI